MTSDGNSFQTFMPATGNKRSPIEIVLTKVQTDAAERRDQTRTSTSSLVSGETVLVGWLGTVDGTICHNCHASLTAYTQLLEV